jgi:hypothetical protein
MIHHEEATDPVLAVPEDVKVGLLRGIDGPRSVRCPHPFSLQNPLVGASSEFMTGDKLTIQEASDQPELLIRMYEDRRTNPEDRRGVI